MSVSVMGSKPYITLILHFNAVAQTPGTQSCNVDALVVIGLKDGKVVSHLH